MNHTHTKLIFFGIRSVIAGSNLPLNERKLVLSYPSVRSLKEM